MCIIYIYCNTYTYINIHISMTLPHLEYFWISFNRTCAGSTLEGKGGITLRLAFVLYSS
jgi:hypothetical protein